MGLTQNDALRNILANAFADSFDGGTLQIRTASGAALLATITLPNPAFSAAAAGVVSKSGAWSVTASGTGTARVARFISADTTKVAEVSIGQSGSGADMIIDDEDIVTGGTVTVVSFTYTCPAS